MKGGRKASEQTGVCLAPCSVLASGKQKQQREGGADDAQAQTPAQFPVWSSGPSTCRAPNLGIFSPPVFFHSE